MSLHLTAAQIVAYRDGEWHDTKAWHHVSACACCRRRVRRAQHLADLLASCLHEWPDSHPATDALAAFIDDITGADDQALIERHLETCVVCRRTVAWLRNNIWLDF